MRNISIINGPNFLPPVDQLRRRVEELTARSDYPQGMLRQFDAILGHRQPAALHAEDHRADRRHARLAGSDGAAPKRPRAGPVIDGARYVVVDGMGHDLPEPVWRPVVEALTENMA